MKNNNQQIQQGDILLCPISKIPTGCKAIKDKRGVVLAEGEISGHYHAIEKTNGVQLMEAPDRIRYLVVGGARKSASLTHQEHKPVSIPPGTYRLGIVREKDWFSEMVRPVID